MEQTHVLKPNDITTEEQALAYISERGTYYPYWNDDYFDYPLLWQAYQRLTKPNGDWVIYNGQVWDNSNLDDQIHMGKQQIREYQEFLRDREDESCHVK